MTKVKKKARKVPGREDPFRHHYRSFQQQLKALPAPRYGARLFRGAVAGDLTRAVGGESPAASSVFFSTLAEWREHNLTEGFKELSKKCYPLATSVALVLHNRDKLDGFLRESAEAQLAERSDLALEPILELWRALAMDLGGELFRPFVQGFCRAAVAATGLENTKLIQQACSSLSDVLKIVQRSCDRHEELLAAMVEDGLLPAWPCPDKTPPEILMRLAAVAGQVVRRSNKKSGLHKFLLDKSTCSSKLWPFTSLAFLSSCLAPFPTTDAWSDLADKIFSNIPNTSQEGFWNTCFQLASKCHADHYDLLAAPVARRCREGWATDHQVQLAVLKAALTNQPDNESSRQALENLEWVAKQLPRMGESGVSFQTVRDLALSQLPRMAFSGRSAQQDAERVVEAFVTTWKDGHYTLEDLCGLFLSLDKNGTLWRAALDWRLKTLTMSMETSESNLLSVAKVVSNIMDGGEDGCQSDSAEALFVTTEGQPERKNSFPNRMIRHLVGLLPTWEDEPDKVELLTTCLVFLRPISADLFGSMAVEMQKVLVSKTGTAQLLPHQATVLSLFRGMRKTFCPLTDKVNSSLLAVIVSNLSDPVSSEIFRLVTTGDPEGVKKMLPDPARIHDDLVASVMSPNREVRINNLQSMCALNQGREAESAEALHRAESASPSMGEYRERMRLFQAAGAVSGPAGPRARSAYLRVLLCNLYEDFTWLWKPAVDMATEFEGCMDREEFWKVVSLILEREGGSAAPSSGKAASSSTVSQNLLRLVTNLERNLDAEEVSFLVKIFLERTSDSGAGRTTKAAKVLLQGFLQAFAKNCPKDTRERESVLGRAMDLLKDGSSEVQAAAVDFLAGHTKGVGQYREGLLNLTDKHKWKKQIRNVVDDFPTLGSNPRLKSIMRRTVIGMLRRTAREKAAAQRVSRKVILQSTALIGKDFLAEVIFELVADLNPAKEGEWDDSVNYQMVVDLCIFSKSMMLPEDQARMNEYYADVLLQLSSQPGLFDSAKLTKKFLDAVMKISKSSRDLDAGVILGKGVVDACILPAFKCRRLPTKLFSILDSWAESELFACFFSGRPKAGLLLLHTVEAFKSEDATAALALNVVCKVVRRLGEDENELLEERAALVRTVWGEVGKALAGWLAGKPLDVSHAASDRLFALRFALGRGWLDGGQREQIALRLAGSCRVLEDKLGDDWLQTMVELVRGAPEGGVPDCVFRCVMALKEGERRERLCASVTRAMGIEENNLDTAVQDLIDRPPGANGRKENLFVFYATFALLYKYAGTSWAQGMNMILKYLKKLLKEDTAEFHHVAHKCLVPQVKRGLRSKDDSIFSTCITLLRFFLDKTSRGPLRDLVPLMDQDDDTDFFENVKHLQLHRRARIMRRVAARLEKGDLVLSETTLAQVMLPAARRYVLNPEYKDQTDLVEAAVTLIGAVCCRLRAEEYVKLLEDLVGSSKREEVEGTKQFRKQKVDVISKILQGFSYDAEALSEKTRVRLLRLLSVLLKQMRREESVSNLHVYISVAKLTTFLAQQSCVNTIVLDLCSRLRGKFFKDREVVRKTVLQVMDILGPRYLLYFISSLDSALQRGYQVHVRIASMAYVLNGLRELLDPAVTGPLVPRVMDNVVLELFSDFSKEKKIQAILKKTPEAKRESAYHVLRLLAAGVAKDSLLDLLRPFLVPRGPGTHRGDLGQRGNHEMLEKTRKAMQAVAKGVEENRHLDSRDKLVLAYGMLNGRLGEEWVTTNRFYGGLQQEFCLSVLLSSCKAAETTADDIRPFVPYLLSAVRSDDVGVSTAALTLVNGLLRHRATRGLFESRESLSQLLDQACKNMRRFHRNQDVKMFTLTCQVLEVVLLQKEDGDTSRGEQGSGLLGKDEASVIKSYCLSALDAHPVRCIKILSMLTRRTESFDKAGSLDLLKHICKLYVERSSQPLTGAASAVLLAESARTGIVFDFMVENFSYPEPQGRLRVVEFLLRMVTNRHSLPGSHVQKLFLLSAYRLANEESLQVRRKVEELTVSVFRSGPQGAAQADAVLKWANSSETVWRLLAAKMSLLAGRAGLVRECAAATRALVAAVLGTEDMMARHDLPSTKLRCDVVDACLLLSRADRSAEDLSFLDQVSENLVHLMLSPMAELRSRLLPLILCLMEKASEAPTKKAKSPSGASPSPWVAPPLIEKFVANHFDLLKTCPSDCSTGTLTRTFHLLLKIQGQEAAEDKFFFRLRRAFNLERKEHPDEYGRRRVVARVLGEVASAVSREQAGRWTRFLLPFRDSEEVGEDVKAAIKVLDAQVEEEGVEGAQEQPQQRKTSPDKRAKKRIVSNSRHVGAKRQKL